MYYASSDELHSDSSKNRMRKSKCMQSAKNQFCLLIKVYHVKGNSGSNSHFMKGYTTKLNHHTNFISTDFKKIVSRIFCMVENHLKMGLHSESGKRTRKIEYVRTLVVPLA